MLCSSCSPWSYCSHCHQRVDVAGLLIKQMLELSEGGHHSAMQQNTCGVLMYSVPHRGLSLAALTSQIHFLLYPSTEVQELSIGKSPGTESRNSLSDLQVITQRGTELGTGHSSPTLVQELGTGHSSPTLVQELGTGHSSFSEAHSLVLVTAHPP